MCGFCDIQNAAPINIFSEEEIERIVIGVYSVAFFCDTKKSVFKTWYLFSIIL